MIADLTGRTALVTGAGQGLGREIALVLAEQGAAVAAGDVRAELAAETAAAVEGRGGRALALMLDELERFFGGAETLYDLTPRVLAGRRGEPWPPPAG